jgi:hypothetical protein
VRFRNCLGGLIAQEKAKATLEHIVPKFSIDLSRDALKTGRDTQLETATEVAEAL